MRTAKRLFYALVFLIFLLFIFQNYSTLTSSHSLQLNLGLFLLESVPLPFYLIVILSFVFGFLLASLIAFFERRPLKRERKELRDRNRELETRIASLSPKNEPSQGDAASPRPSP
jgi:uncharacterized integral membrane protein